MKVLYLTWALSLVVCIPAIAQRYPSVPSFQELSSYLLAHQTSPEDYVIQKFTEHDVVILGEYHHIRHDGELIQRLIPRCYENNVRVLAIEFADRSSQRLIDSLLALAVYNESLAKQITFAESPDWAYQEYLDIYKAAWTVNHALPAGAPKFRIIGINCAGDWSIIKTRADLQNDSLRRLVWEKCPDLERRWAYAILQQVERGEKVLVYCGMHHALTRYFQAIVDGDGKFVCFAEEERMGRMLHLRLGPRVFSISLHYGWSPARSTDKWQRPANGMIDSTMALLGTHFAPVGFDVVGSPFGLLTDSVAVYHVGYPDFRLRDFCDGYIFQRPFCEYEVDHFVEDFINPANFAEFRRQAGDPWFRNATLEQSKNSLRRQLERERASYRGL